MDTRISHGSVATRLRMDGTFSYYFTTISLLSAIEKSFWKSADIGKVMDKSIVVSGTYFRRTIFPGI